MGTSMFDADDLLKVFGTTITDNISLTEYKNFREGKYEPVETKCLDCRTSFTTRRPAWGYKPQPVAVYCEWCREMNAIRYDKKARYWSVVKYWSPEDDVVEEPEEEEHEHCSCVDDGWPCCGC